MMDNAWLIMWANHPWRCRSVAGRLIIRSGSNRNDQSILLYRENYRSVAATSWSGSYRTSTLYWRTSSGTKG